MHRSTQHVIVAAACVALNPILPVQAGTAVGHPVQRAVAGQGLTITEASTTLGAARFEPCAGGPATTVVLNETYDLVEEPVLTVPQGCWRRVYLMLDDFCVAGEGGSGGDFEICLAPGIVRPTLFDDLIVVASGGQAIVLRYGAEDWITESSLGITDGSSITVDHESEEHQDLVSDLSQSTTIDIDAPGSGS